MASRLINPRHKVSASPLRVVIEELNEPVIVTDREAIPTLTNSAADRFFRRGQAASASARELADRNYFELSRLLASVSKTEPGRVADFILLNISDRSEVRFEATISPTYENGEWTGMVTALRESTSSDRDLIASLEQSRAAEEVTRRDRDRLSRVIENFGDPIIVADDSARITLLDALARRLFGSDQPGVDDRVLANRIKLDAYLTAFTFSFLERQDKTLSFYDPKSRTEMEYAARSGKIYDHHGQCSYTVTVLRDLSTWKKIERLQVERRMLEMEKFAATGKLAGTIAHEINNPMEAIKNAIYLLRDKLDPASQPIYDALKNETERVTRIVRQMLGLYRNAGNFGSFDLNSVVEDTLTLFSRPLEKAGVTVTKRLGRLPAIKGSADQFRQLLSNLVVNAADSMPNGGTLTIRTRYIRSVREGYGQGSLTVCDTGCGIPPEVRSTMFEPFITTKGEKGTGLGLWIVKGIVEGHSGRILVRSTPDRGTIFKIVFPVSPA